MQQQKISNLVFVTIFGVNNVIFTSYFAILMKLTKAWFNLLTLKIYLSQLIPTSDNDEETIDKINLVIYNFKLFTLYIY